jgi:hypothetical protein
MPLNTNYRFLISPQLGINFMTPRAAVMRSKNPALARHPGNASHSARRPALRRTKAVIRDAFRGASCNQGSASITAMSPSPSLSKWASSSKVLRSATVNFMFILAS